MNDEKNTQPVALDVPPVYPHTRMVSDIQGQRMELTPGMDLLDYFAAHAPVMPSWYSETDTIQNQILEVIGQVVGDKLPYVTSGVLPISDMLANIYGRLSEMLADRKANHAANIEANSERFIQWRWDYAVSMCQARQAMYAASTTRDVTSPIIMK